MIEAYELEITLVGGPMDGDTITLAAKGSIEPPGMLSYIGVHNEQACYLVYGAGLLGETTGWPEDKPAKHQYHFWGYCELKKL